MEALHDGIELLLTDSSHADFIGLIAKLDEGLAATYGELQKQYDRHNKLELIKDVVILYRRGVPAACGAFRECGDYTVEIKRVYCSNEFRRQGFAKMVMGALEARAKGKGYRHAVLETGIRQKEAIHLYQSIGYVVIENYGPYVGNANSVCMGKDL